jgi:hypothetical protein
MNDAIEYNYLLTTLRIIVVPGNRILSKTTKNFDLFCLIFIQIQIMMRMNLSNDRCLPLWNIHQSLV